MAKKEARKGREAHWRSPVAKANLVHNVAFLVAVILSPPWSWIGLGLLVATVVVQVRIWSHPLEGSVGNVAGVTLAMWFVEVSGYRNDARPNVGLAILILATEVIVTLIAVSLARWRRERLTPPGAGA